MPLTGPIPEGRSFFCSRCGALYSVTYSRQRKSVDIGDDDNGAECVVCGQIMARWSSTAVPTFKLVQRPEDAA
jgi:transcription elongation factor Elf1